MSEDRLRIEVTCDFPAGRLDEEVARVRTELIELGLRPGPDMDLAEERLREAIGAEAEKGDGETIELESVLLLEGTPMTRPEDARIEWGGDFMAKGFVVDSDTDAVDYRRHAANPSVEQGQLLARLIPVKLGKAGKDVLGKRIDPRKPKTIRIRVGKNVRHDDASGEYYAEKAGRVRYVSDMLSVDDVYEIQGSVGLKTGHIDHPGAIVVGIDVEPDSKVTAVGDIEVRGSVEEALVISGGNVTVKGGIVGRKACRVVAEGNVEASFIQHCTVEAGGDVIVAQEIHLCTIRARGSVIVKGRIVGGNVSAIRGIDVGQIGTDAGVRTEMSVGKDWVIEEKIAQKKEAIEAATENLKKVKAAIAPLQNRFQSLQGEAKQQAVTLLKKARDMAESVEQAKGELEELFEQFRQGWNKKIIVRSILKPDAILTIGPQKAKFESVVQGPRKLVLRNNELRFMPLGDKDTLEDAEGTSE